MKTFLKIISYVFQPLVMPLFGIMLLMQIPINQLFPNALLLINESTYKTIAIAGTLLFTAVLPALPILIMMRRGQIKDLFI